MVTIGNDRDAAARRPARQREHSHYVAKDPPKTCECSYAASGFMPPGARLVAECRFSYPDERLRLYSSTVDDKSRGYHRDTVGSAGLM